MADYSKQALKLWRQCVSPAVGPQEPVEGFEIFSAVEEPGAQGGTVYQTVHCIWQDDEWVDQDDQVIALAQYHDDDEPQEELDDAWQQFCGSVEQLNIEKAQAAAALNSAVNTAFEAEPRGRLSALATPEQTQ